MPELGILRIVETNSTLLLTWSIPVAILVLIKLVSNRNAGGFSKTQKEEKLKVVNALLQMLDSQLHYIEKLQQDNRVVGQFNDSHILLCKEISSYIKETEERAKILNSSVIQKTLIQYSQVSSGLFESMLKTEDSFKDSVTDYNMSILRANNPHSSVVGSRFQRSDDKVLVSLKKTELLKIRQSLEVAMDNIKAERSKYMSQLSNLTFLNQRLTRFLVQYRKQNLSRRFHFESLNYV